ncbi:MAG: alpha/beta hydrolase [Aeromicrobium sp.]|nr:MAG: alpha/beta hydrolase [Aeromicrobium sp.]
MKSIQHKNFDMSYLDEGSGPTILMLHNGGTSSTIWRNQIESLSTTHRVVAVDLPGFGTSGRGPRPATLDDLVDITAALLTSLDVGPVLVVGNCMGTNIAVQLSRRHPELVQGIIAINPLTEVSFSGGHIGFLHTMKRSFSLGTRALRSLSRHIRTPRFFTPIVLRFQLGPKGIAKNLHHDPELVACQLRADQLPALIDVLDDMGSYGQIDSSRTKNLVPTWIVWGDKNLVLSRNDSSHLRTQLNAERLEVIPGCGHLPMLEDPETITSLILDLEAHISAADKKAVS